MGKDVCCYCNKVLGRFAAKIKIGKIRPELRNLPEFKDLPDENVICPRCSFPITKTKMKELGLYPKFFEPTPEYEEHIEQSKEFDERNL